MKVLVMTDMEGVAGVVWFEEQTYPTGKHFEAAKKLLKPLKPLVWKSPFVLEKRFFHTDQADVAAASPDAERIDSPTVLFRSRDILRVACRGRIDRVEAARVCSPANVMTTGPSRACPTKDNR